MAADPDGDHRRRGRGRGRQPRGLEPDGTGDPAEHHGPDHRAEVGAALGDAGGGGGRVGVGQDDGQVEQARPAPSRSEGQRGQEDEGDRVAERHDGVGDGTEAEQRRDGAEVSRAEPVGTEPRDDADEHADRAAERRQQARRRPVEAELHTAGHEERPEGAGGAGAEADADAQREEG